jgi:aminoglycoside phosphotransferase (APT) family kinase protein
MTGALIRDRFPDAALLEGRGLSNVKFRAGDVLVRVNVNLPASAALARFQKAAFCAEICARTGVPTPEVLEVGTLTNGRPYSVERWVDDTVPADLVRDPAVRLRLWRELGEIIASLHRADLGGRERAFELGYDGEGPTQSWAERLGLVCDPVLREQLRPLGRYPSGLNHGDLKLDNVLLRRDTLQIAAIVDWELARYVPVPLGEFSTSVEPAVLPIKEHAVARAPAERAALLEGLGHGPADLPDFWSYYRSDVDLNLRFYERALAAGRPDHDVLVERHARYLAGVREDLR